jgi:hypothetical protein
MHRTDCIVQIAVLGELYSPGQSSGETVTVAQPNE